MDTKNFSWLGQKKWIALIVVVLVIVLIRIYAHGYLLKKTQKYLATFSPVYSGHIDDLKLRILRGSYGFKNLTLTLRKKPIRFLEVQDIDVTIDWVELFKGNIRTDIRADQLKLLYSDYVIDQISQAPQENAEQAKSAGETLFPISIEKINLVNSTIASADFFGVSDQLPVVVEDLNAEITNLTPTPPRQISYYKFDGKIGKSSPLEISGNFNMFNSPVDWNARVMIKEFILKTTNPWMLQAAPLSFKKGSLNIYSEAQSISGKIKGYAKPFVSDAEFVGDDKDFKGFDQLGIEIGLAALNMFFQNPENQTVATKVEFSYEDQKFEWNFWQALKGLFKNGYKEKLSEGFDSPGKNSTPEAAK